MCFLLLKKRRRLAAGPINSSGYEQIYANASIIRRPLLRTLKIPTCFSPVDDTRGREGRWGLFRVGFSKSRAVKIGAQRRSIFRAFAK